MQTNWIVRSVKLFVLATVLAAGLFVSWLSPAHAERMSFSLTSARGLEGCSQTCSTIVLADGQIDNSSPDRFDALVRNHLGPRPRGLTVLIRSPGGYVIAAAKLGLLFRKYNATVVVATAGAMNLRSGTIKIGPAMCISACVYAFMGGRKRVVPAGGSLVLHRSYADGTWFRGREYDNDFVRQYILAYAKSMGVATAPITYAERLPPYHVQALTRAQIREWKLGTVGF